MDEARARRISAELAGREVGGWPVKGFVNHGKSAVVLLSERAGQRAALKIFDPDLIDRYGEQTQLGRIDREVQLKGRKHPHLIQILDGGKCPVTGHLFVVMEYFYGPTLSQMRASLPRSNIGPIISQVAAAAQFLETQNLAHRDIKPENIGLTPDSSEAVLSDLGVIRAMGTSDLTDSTDSKPFVGTLRYSSPEFLLREEEDTIEGWRALTFYQLGATLYEMIMRRRLFDEFTEPFARLVKAVQEEVPGIDAPDVPQPLCQLARDCLIKDPSLRLKLVDWNSFYLREAELGVMDVFKERIRRRELRQTSKSRVLTPSAGQAKDPRHLAEQVMGVVRRGLISSRLFPRMRLDYLQSGASVTVSSLFVNRSREHLLARAFELACRFQYLDNSNPIVEVSVCARYAGKVEDIQACPWYGLYCGADDVEVLASKIEPVAFQVLDAAQELGERGHTAEVFINLDHREI